MELRNTANANIVGGVEIMVFMLQIGGYNIAMRKITNRLGFRFMANYN